MTLSKLTENLNIIAGLGTTPQERGMTTDVFKAKFDEAAKIIKTYVNEILTVEVENSVDAKAEKSTNEATAIDGQVMTANGDGTFTYKAPTGGAPIDSPNFTGMPTVSANMIYHTGNITLGTTAPVEALADGVQAQVY